MKHAEETLNILFATPECTPFAHTGGLGEVAGSLPKALNRLRGTQKDSGRPVDCRVILPLYEKIGQEWRDQMSFLGWTMVPLAWRQQYAGLFRLDYEGTTYYFVDNEYYFKRPGLYGFDDDGERYAFFSKAVFEVVRFMNWIPQVIHANDWQTALIPVYQNSFYHWEGLRTVFSVHNIEYQGYYNRGFSDYVLGLPEDCVHFIAFGDGVNLTKGGIECADIFSTVSPSYAEELKDPANAFGLHEIVQRNAHKLCGILNGIDTSVYDPAHDASIAAPYSSDDLSGKAVCKEALQKELNLPVKDVPLITMISRLVPAKGVELLEAVMDDILWRHDVQFVLLGTGFHALEEWFRGLQERHPDQVRSLITFDIPLSHRIYAGGDILLVPSRSEPCGLTQMIGCRYGNVPLVRATGGLKDSIRDCSLGEGNGFVFERYDPADLHGALENAIFHYWDRENWSLLQAYDLSLDFSWSVSACRYRDMYESLV